MEEWLSILSARRQLKQRAKIARSKTFAVEVAMIRTGLEQSPPPMLCLCVMDGGSQKKMRVGQTTQSALLAKPKSNGVTDAV
jgi:hypothetical protein